MKFWIEIQASDGTKYGDGPIVTAVSWTTVARLDKAGSFSFRMPASDPRAALVQAKREAWCYGLVNSAVTLLGAGIIDEISLKVAAGATMIDVSGDDLLRELTNRSVGFLEITDGNGAGSTTALADIMAEAPSGWALDTVNGYGSTAGTVYASFAGELVLAALGKVAEHTGEHFRLGSGRKVVWLRDSLTASGLRAIGQADAVAVEGNNDVCLITELERVQASYDLITRVFAFGSGNGRARATLADATVTPAAGYVIDASHPKGANLTASTPQATYGIIERFLSWKEIGPVTNTEADIESAANALYAAAYQYLSKYCQPNASYRLSVTKLAGIVYPGQQIRVIWREVVDGYTSVDIDDDLTILETTTRIDAAGVRTVGLQVSTIDAWPRTFAEIIADQMEEARLMDGHPQTFAGYYSEGFGNFNISPTYSAVARFKFDDRVTRLVSAVLRFRTDAFEATATAASSGGGSAATSASGGSVSQSSGSNSANHGHNISIFANAPSGSYPMYVGPSGGIFYYGPNQGTKPAATGTTNADHSHSINIASHTHGITIPSHTHGLSYGIQRSGTYPGGVTIWIDGVDKTFDLTGQTSLGTSSGSTGVVEVELADLINANLRSEHTVEFKCASGYGRILNAALRCFVIVQAIYVLPAGATSSPSTPAAPTVAVAGTADGWRITWLAVSGAQSYRIYGNTVGSDSGATEITLTTSREVVVPYSSGYTWFAGTSIAGANESAIGTWATDASAPTTPTWTSHAYVADGHLLSWYHPDQETIEYFVLYRNSVGATNGSEAEITTLAGTALSYLAAFAATGDYFGIKAINYAGNSSSIIWAGPYDPTPATPGGVTVAMTSGGFVINWNATAKAARYEVQAATDGSGTSALTVWSGNALVTPTLATGSRRYFRVRAVGFDDTASAWSSWLTDSTAPPTPVINRVSEDNTQVTIFIDTSDTSHNAAGFSHYIVQRADNASGTNTTTVDSAAPYAPALVYPIASTGTVKYYRLIAVDVAGNQSAATNWTVSIYNREPSVKDYFDGYGGPNTAIESLYWMQISAFDEGVVTDPYSLDAWYSSDTISEVAATTEGATSVSLTASLSLSYKVSTRIKYNAIWALDTNNRFTDNDFFLLVADISDINALQNTSGALEIKIVDYYSVYATAQVARSALVTGRNYIKIKHSDFTVTGGFDWDAVGEIWLSFLNNAGYTATVIFDDMRIAKADPSDATTYNDTGGVWKPGKITSGNPDQEWHIYPGNRSGEPVKPFSFGTIKEHNYWDFCFVNTSNIITGTVQTGFYKKSFGTSGYAGIVFFASDTTPSSVDAYVAWVIGDLLQLRRAIPGGAVAAQVTLPATSETNKMFWIGVDLREFISDPGRIKVYTSETEGNLIQASNLRISYKDPSPLPAWGKVGVVAYSSIARFFDFTAGSPAHAEVADVARALDGPMIDGQNGSQRVYFSVVGGALYFSTDRVNWTAV